MRVWLLLGVAFVASVCVSCSNTHEEQLCLEICESEKDPYLLQLCKNRCKLVPEREKEEEEEERGSRERGRQEGEKEEKKRDERELPQPPHHHQHKDDRQRGKESEEKEKKDEQLWRGRHRWDDPEERERVRQRVEEEDIRRRRHKKDLPVDGYDPQTYHNNPFYFTSRMFTTRYKNQYGHIRILHPFHLRFPKLLNYMIVEFMFKPNTLLLPAHADIDSIIVILSGKALVTFFNPNNRQNYYLQPGYAQRIPPGTTFTVANLENNQDLRLIKLAIPVNEPAHYQNFFLSSTQDQQSYLQGFSPNILQASFNAEFEEIYRVLFGGEGRHEGEQRQQEGVIVELSEEQIQELSKHAKSTSRKPIPFQYEPFYLRSPYPIYSNNFGKFFEVTPENNPQLKDLDIYLNSVDINEGALLLPHFNSKAIVILVIIEGKANVELVGIQPEQQEEQETREVQRYEAELSQDDIFVIPAAYPVVVNATTNLSFFAFGINAENNRRIFLAGEKDNVITHMYRAVKELAFPGSARDLQKLLKNQKGSYFVDARARPLSSILGALYYTE